MTLHTHTWDISIMARAAIVHCENYSEARKSNFALFRREKIITADGSTASVPIVSGNSFRGILRRIGEHLTASALGYEDHALPVPAAHLLTNGGRLAKSGTPLTDEAERELKALLPLVAVFGAAASGRLMSGLLSVSKVLPEIAELNHILFRPAHSMKPLPSVQALSEESFTHLDDHRPNLGQAPRSDHRPSLGQATHGATNDGSPLARIAVETLPAGTRFQARVRIDNANRTQLAFTHDILTEFATNGHLGGRRAAGYGSVTATLDHTLPNSLPKWRAELRRNRDQAIAALLRIT